MPYFESTNSSLRRKCALWNFDGKCLPFTPIAALFYNYWKLYLWECRSKQILPNIYGFRAKVVAKYDTEKKSGTKNSLKESGY